MSEQLSKEEFEYKTRLMARYDCDAALNKMFTLLSYKSPSERSSQYMEFEELKQKMFALLEVE